MLGSLNIKLLLIYAYCKDVTCDTCLLYTIKIFHGVIFCTHKHLIYMKNCLISEAEEALLINFSVDCKYMSPLFRLCAGFHFQQTKKTTYFERHK